MLGNVYQCMCGLQNLGNLGKIHDAWDSVSRVEQALVHRFEWCRYQQLALLDSNSFYKCAQAAFYKID